MLCDQVEFATDRDVFISYICYYHLYYLSIGDTELAVKKLLCSGCILITRLSDLTRADEDTNPKAQFMLSMINLSIQFIA